MVDRTEYGFWGIEKQTLMRNKERVTAVYAAISGEVQRWGIRSAFDDSSVGAITLIVFLKFLSDRREYLKLDVSDLFRFDALWNLYPNVLSFCDITHYVGQVERQLGFEEHLAEAFTKNVQYDRLDDHFTDILRLVDELDFKSKQSRMICFEKLIDTIIRMAEQEGKSTVKVYTERNIGKFLGAIVKLQEGMSIYDPCAGLGISLIDALKGKEGVQAYAQEIDRNTAAVLEMLMIMGGHTCVTVQCNNTLANPITKYSNIKFDRIICEPPMNQKVNVYDYNRMLENSFVEYNDYNMNDSWIFVKHIVAALKSGGRAAVLLPMSMMTREGITAKFRDWLLYHNLVDAIIELPGGALSKTGVKASVMVLQKGKINDSVYMLDLSRGLWDKKVRKSDSPDNGLAELVYVVVNYIEIEGISKQVSLQEIKRNDGQLAVARYIGQKIDMENFRRDLVLLFNEAESLDQEYGELCREFKMALSKYNDYCNKY